MDFFELEKLSNTYVHGNAHQDFEEKVQVIKEIVGKDMVIMNVKTDRNGEIIPNPKHDVIYENNDIRNDFRKYLIRFFRLINKTITI